MRAKPIPKSRPKAKPKPKGKPTAASKEKLKAVFKGKPQGISKKQSKAATKVNPHRIASRQTVVASRSDAYSKKISRPVTKGHPEGISKKITPATKAKPQAKPKATMAEKAKPNTKDVIALDIQPVPKDIKVCESEKMPEGYTFVMKGNIYITKHCRQMTHDAGLPLYVAMSGSRPSERVGIRCPRDIFVQARQMHYLTYPERLLDIHNRDAVMTKEFAVNLDTIFPNMPTEDKTKLIRHAMKKGKGRVGRTATRTLEKKIQLATSAYIRHELTDYDRYLSEGMERDAAREKVFPKVKKVMTEWKDKTTAPK
jgi:hypothetical protein